MNLFDERVGAPPSPRSLGWYWLRVIAQDLTSPGRAALAVMVVFVLLATSGWTAMRHQRPPQDPRAAAVSAWLHGSVAGRRLPNPDHSTAGAVGRFFAGLTATQRRRLADRYPLVVGNLAGAPVTLRYRANRTALRQARSDELHRSHAVDLTQDGRVSALKLADRYADLAAPGRQILAFDPSGQGRVAEVFGDLDTARRTAIVVPGVDTDVMTFEKSVKPYSTPDGMARALYASEHDAAPHGGYATIAWADYTAPVGIGLDASIGTMAEAGAVRLNTLVRSLPARTSVQLFCHSYGSVLCGVGAARLPQRKVTDIAVYGSPGMRARDVAALHTSARVWAARDATDWIQDVPYVEVAGVGHGADPVSPAFGARIISAAGAQQHTGYFAAGTESLRNFTRIALGRYAAVRCASDDADCAAGTSTA
ncbi:alpha/beta hydrolase [Streptomyces sp. SL13]|uniref:Alpha/beta hydrolase n=1 Tax=Streptantibioticus silvisoli TaxID=2705255 RepID=A0AA90K6S2_9ACTN|nr:alpha/beta hydrolase [Streptantibioticus silvisoli]MDI5968098.1 alpha/beta hydrolase [Streptantibioticus silvisoli]